MRSIVCQRVWMLHCKVQPSGEARDLKVNNYSVVRVGELAFWVNEATVKLRVISACPTAYWHISDNIIVWAETVFRLRTHHVHLYRINKEHPAKCVYCPDCDETVEHFLFHCQLYNIRSRLLPAQPNIPNTLYGSTTQLQQTPTYNISAMDRRDKIVRSLEHQESLKQMKSRYPI